MATLYHQVWINASTAMVYKAIGTADGLGKWWAPHQSTDTDSGLVWSHDPGPEHGVVRFKVLERTPDRHVEWECISSHPADSPASAWTGTRIRFEVSERGNKRSMSGFGADGDRVTVLDFRHSGWDENNVYLGFCNFAWSEALKELKKWCELQGK